MLLANMLSPALQHIRNAGKLTDMHIHPAKMPHP
jgi:hypothetical protein